MNVALVLAWIPVIVIARGLMDQVVAGAPSDDLLAGGYLAVIGTLVIITVAYLFGIVLANKFALQNQSGVHRRMTLRIVTAAAVLYLVIGVVAFA
jgi:hypothetical protein